MNSSVVPVSFEEMLAHLASRHKLDLRGYKYSTLRRRTQRRMEQLRITGYDRYLSYVDEHPGEVTELLYSILINVTKFFRDPTAWQIVRKDVLPMLFALHRVGETFKVWCAGCSTGEEAYTIALLIAEHLGPHLKEYDVKIYATDHDDHALQVARKGYYNISALSSIPTEFHHDLNVNGDSFRLERDVRRLVIFGRSNIVADAPISHVKLLICRNLLIYFDPSAQRHIMGRLRYAVDPGGVLFLGKSESQLSGSPHFITLNSRWRIFERTQAPSPLERPKNMSSSPIEKDRLNERAQEALVLLKAFHHTVLETIEPGIIILDSEDSVISENESARRIWQLGTLSVGGKIDDSALMRKCPNLKQHLDAARGTPFKTVRFDCMSPGHRDLAIAIRPIESHTGEPGLLGTLIYMEDVTPREDLQQTVEELQTTAEELQSTNEELETTNEELQSTNEELETTNEELQSTNEELETTNEELKSLNEELEDINEELAKRSKELSEANLRYSEMVERMPWPMLVLTGIEDLIGVYNAAAQRLFGFATPSNQGMTIRELPMTASNRELLSEKLTMAAKNGHVVVEAFELLTNAGAHKVRLHVNPMRHGAENKGAIIMFEPIAAKSAGPSKSAVVDGHANRRSSDGRSAAGRSSDGRAKSSTNGNPKASSKKPKVKAKSSSRPAPRTGRR